MIGSTLLHAAPGGTAVPELGALSHDAQDGKLPAFLDQSLAALEIGVAN
jgi:hypothetical protein